MKNYYRLKIWKNGMHESKDMIVDRVAHDFDMLYEALKILFNNDEDIILIIVEDIECGSIVGSHFIPRKHFYEVDEEFKEI